VQLRRQRGNFTHDHEGRRTDPAFLRQALPRFSLRLFPAELWFAKSADWRPGSIDFS